MASRPKEGTLVPQGKVRHVSTLGKTTPPAQLREHPGPEPCPLAVPSTSQSLPAVCQSFRVPLTMGAGTCKIHIALAIGCDGQRFGRRPVRSSSLMANGASLATAPLGSVPKAPPWRWSPRDR